MPFRKKKRYARWCTKAAGALRVSCIVGSLPAITRAVFVKVTIADAAGKTLLDTTSEGPWFLAKLPAGNYQIVATFAGNAEKRTIAVGTEKLKTIDFRWGAE